MLVSIRWDGTDEKEHVKVEGPTPAGATDGLRPTRIAMAPRGDQALVELQRNVYTVTVPPLGAAPTINVSNPENAAFPARRLTDLGGEFPAWSADGRTVHWSLGNAWFSYDLDEAQAFEERREAEAEADDEAADAGAAEADGPADAGPGDDADGVGAGPDQDPAGDGDADDSDEAGDAEDADEDAEFRAAEVRVVIDAARDLPEGVAVLRGARAVTMNGEEIIDDADIVVRGPRIEAVGARGEVDVPADATVIDVSGRTVVPGFVDTHAHLRARDELHRTDVWPYLANLAYGVTTTRDPQTGNTEVLSYADMVRAGDGARPPHLFHGARRLLAGRHRHRGRGAGRPQALCRLLRHQDHQDVRGGGAQGPAAHHRCRARARPDADDRGGAEHPAEPDRDPRRLPRPGALHPHLPGVRRLRAALRRDRARLHAHAARVLRGAVGRELVLQPREPPRRRQAAALRAPRRDRRAHPASRAVVPRRAARVRAARALRARPRRGRGGAPAWAATASSRGWATTGSCGRWPRRA